MIKWQVSKSCGLQFDKKLMKVSTSKTKNFLEKLYLLWVIVVASRNLQTAESGWPPYTDVVVVVVVVVCQNELTLLYPQVFKDFFIKFKHCFSKFKEFSRRKSFSRSFQGPSSFSRSIPGPCEPWRDCSFQGTLETAVWLCRWWARI